MVKYDLDALTVDGILAANNAVKLYYTYQDYFNELSAFLDDWHTFLQVYNPTLVIYGDDIRKSFLNECAHIRATLSQLGVVRGLTELNYIEDAVIRGDVKSLSDGIGTFHATLNIVADIIKAGQLSDSLALVMAVDDSPEVLTLLDTLLSNHYRLLAVTDGMQAMQALRSHTPALFILDIEMPGLNGYELALLIREDSRFTQTPILFLTGAPSRENVLAAMQYHINDFMVKPIDKATLLAKIKKQLPR